MKSLNPLRNALAGLIAIGALALTQNALGVPSIVLSTSDPLYYNLNSGPAQLAVDFRVTLDAGDNVNNILTFMNSIVAYNPAVLQFDSITFGNALSATGAPPTTIDTGDVNYQTDPSNLKPSVLTTYRLGTPVDMGGYWDGSLWPLIEVNPSVLEPANGALRNEILATQGAAGGALLFTIVFDVVTDQLGKSTIVLLDDTDFLDPDSGGLFDYKRYDEGNNSVFYAESNTLDVKVPGPLPLTLVAAGLIGLGVQRRMVRR